MLRLINLVGEESPLTEYKDLKIESILSYGDKTLSFTIPFEYGKGIKEEYYIQTKNDEFVVKELDINGDEIKVKANLNIEELDGTSLDRFDSTEHTITECMNFALVGTSWGVTSSITKHRTIAMTDCTVWEVIKQAIKTYAVELEIDSINKVLNFADHIGSNRGVYFTDQLNLISLSISSDTHDYYTRLIPTGKDGLTIESVNAGKGYVENYQYSNKIRTVRWKDERYTDAQILKDDAELKLVYLSKPYRAYKCSIIDLSKSGEYDILEFAIGDTVTVIDSRTGTKEKQRIVKIVEYPNDYSKNTCELANTVMSFEEMASAYEDTVSTVDNITVDNGTIDGSAIDGIYTSQIYDFDTAVINNATITNLVANYVYVAGELTAVIATVGDLEATMVTTTYLEANYADINLANVATGSIGTALIAQGAIETAQIADGSITDAKIVELTANKITAGTLDAAEIDVVNLNCANLTVGTINGTQITDGVISINKLDTNLTDTINQASNDASEAKTTADGKNSVYYQITAPTGGTYKLNDIWFDTDDSNKMHYWNGTSWLAVLFGTSAIVDNAITADKISDSVNTAISNAQTDANTANTNASTAQTTADGKNTVFYQTSAPSTTGRKTSDIWFDTDDGNRMYRWSGSAWISTQFGTNAIANTSITNALIVDGTIQNAKIGNLDAGKVTTGTLDANRIGANTITADKIVTNTITATSGVFASGAILNAHIADLAVTNAKIADATIATAKIANLAVTGAKIANATITNGNIQDATIQNAKISTLDAGKINTGYLNADRIQALSITSEKISAGAIDATKIIVGSGTVGNGNIASGKSATGSYTGTVVTDGTNLVGSAYASFGVGNSNNNNSESGYIQLDLGSIYRLAESRLFFYSADTRYFLYKIKYSVDGVSWFYAIGNADNTGWVTSSQANATSKPYNPTIDTFPVPVVARYIRVYANGNSVSTANLLYEWELYCATQTIIDGRQITTGTITATQIASRSITADRIVAGAITANEIKASTITGNKIAANTITATNISVSSLSAISANLGTITSGLIQSANYAANTSGTKIDLSTGVIDTKGFKVSSSGVITATSGTIGNFTLSAGALSYASNDSNPMVFKDLMKISATTTDQSNRFNFYLTDKYARFESLYGEGATWDEETHTYGAYYGGVVTINGDIQMVSSTRFGSVSGSITLDSDGDNGMVISCPNRISLNGPVRSYHTISAGSFESSSTNYGLIINSSAAEASIKYVAPGTAVWVAGVNVAQQNYNYAWWNSNVGLVARIDDGGNFVARSGLFVNNGVHKVPFGVGVDYFSDAVDYLYVHSNARGGYGVTWWSSDERLKKNIVDTKENALAMISQINHRTFTWNQKSGMAGKKDLIGYVAQEMEQLNQDFVLKIPQREFVDKPEGKIVDYRYQINEYKIIPYITKAIQELYVQIIDIQKEVAQLRAQGGLK